MIFKGLSADGGLWMFIAFIFGALYGSSLVRVLFGMFFIIKSTMFSFFPQGRRPLSIFGVMHGIGRAETQNIYRKTYPCLDADLRKLRDNPGPMTLPVDNLVDLEFISKEVKPTLDVEKEDIESKRHLIGSEPVSINLTQVSFNRKTESFDSEQDPKPGGRRGNRLARFVSSSMCLEQLQSLAGHCGRNRNTGGL